MYLPVCKKKVNVLIPKIVHAPFVHQWMALWGGKGANKDSAEPMKILHSTLALNANDALRNNLFSPEWYLSDAYFNCHLIKCTTE